MKLSDYIIAFLAKLGIKHAFVVSGGAAVHLIDSIARHSEMEVVCAQHEQNGACAADMYARVTKNYGLAISTSGPGATNMVTSVCNAYFDSVPLICLTGQVARFRIKQTPDLRQRGFQETDVLSIFASITNYVVQVTDPLHIRYELEKALYLAKKGRPGPVVLDIPDDLQREEIEPEELPRFIPEEHCFPDIDDEVKKLLEMIKEAERPVLILGQGIHTASVEEQVLAFARHFHLPICLTWGAADLLEETDPLNMGRVGVCGPRGGNFALQTSDLIIALGTRLSQMITGGKQNLFAPKAKKVMVDIDQEELSKFDAKTFVLDFPIHAELHHFFCTLQKRQEEFVGDHFSAWREQISSWRARYPIVDPSYGNEGRVNPYLFIKQLSDYVPEKSVIIGDTGANLSWTCQTFAFKKNQRIFSAWNHTPMGYAVPAAVGAAFATSDEVVCLTGDGGLMMCLEELATIRRYHLPVKIFLFDNQGHGIQKQTLDTWLMSHYVAVDPPSGLYFPDYEKIAEAFNLPYYLLRNNDEMKEGLQDIYANKGPFFCVVQVIEEQKIVPMLKFGAGLEDLHPPLPADEIERIKKESYDSCRKERKSLGVLSSRNRVSI